MKKFAAVFLISLFTMLASCNTNSQTKQTEVIQTPKAAYIGKHCETYCRPYGSYDDICFTDDDRLKVVSNQGVEGTQYLDYSGELAYLGKEAEGMNPDAVALTVSFYKGRSCVYAYARGDRNGFSIYRDGKLLAPINEIAYNGTAIPQYESEEEFQKWVNTVGYIHFPACQMFEHEGTLYALADRRLVINDRILNAPEGYSVEGIFCLKGQPTAVLAKWNEKGHAECKLVAISEKTEKLRFEGKDFDHAPELYSGATDGHFGYFVENHAVWRTDGEETENLFSLIENGIESSSVRRVLPLSDGGIAVAEGQSLWVFRPQKGENEISVRGKVVIGVVNGMDDDISDAVSAFNRTPSAYAAEIRTFEDTGKLNLAILSREIDMVFTSDVMVMRNYASKEIFADLEECVPKLFEDGALTGNIVEASRIDGYCYFLPRSYEVEGYYMPEEYLRDKKTVTYKDLKDILTEHIEIMKCTTRINRFESFIRSSADQWIDWDERRAHFTDRDFITLLEICMMASPNEETAMMYPISLDFVQYYVGETLPAFFMEDVAYMSQKKHALFMPGDGEEEGFGIYSNSLIGMVSNGECPDGAKDFLEFLFLELPQETGSDGGGFPLNEEALEHVLREVYLDGVPADPVRVELTKTVIQKADHYTYTLRNDFISAILEEGSRYFSGQITAEKAAEFIQNRVQIYLDEQG